MPRLEPAARGGWVAREHDRLLSHVSSGSCDSSAAVSRTSAGLRVRSHDDAHAAVPGPRFDDELLDAVEHRAQHVRHADVVGAHRADQRLLGEVEAHHLLDVGVHQLVVRDAGAERVDAAERAGADRREQRGADMGELPALILEPVFVGPAIDDVHGYAPAVHARDQPVARHAQVGRT